MADQFPVGGVEPGQEDPLVRLGAFLGRFVERQRELAAPFFSGDTPIEEAGRRIVAGETGPQQAIQRGQGRLREAVQSIPGLAQVDALTERALEASESPAGQMVGMLFPGVPGGPTFRSSRDLQAGLRQLDIAELEKVMTDVRRTMSRPEGRGPQRLTHTPKKESILDPSIIPEPYTGSINRQVLEHQTFVRASQNELIRRAQQGDRRALQMLQDDIDNFLYVVGHDLHSIADEGVSLFEVLDEMKMENLNTMIENDALLTLLTDILGT